MGLGPEWTAFIFTLAAVTAVLATGWLQLRESRRELAERERTADLWRSSLDRTWRQLRDREVRLSAAERRYR